MAHFKYNLKYSPKQSLHNCFLQSCVDLKGEFISNGAKYLRLLKTSVRILGKGSLIAHVHRLMCILAGSV